MITRIFRIFGGVLRKFGGLPRGEIRLDETDVWPIFERVEILEKRYLSIGKELYDLKKREKMGKK